jgi:hypothetical protein
MSMAKWSLSLGVLLGLAAVALPWVMPSPADSFVPPAPVALLPPPAPSKPLPLPAPAPPPAAPLPQPVPPPPPLAPPTADGTGRVRVRAFSARDSRPLAGVTVAILRGPPDLTVPLESVLTDASGEALFPAPRAGVFAVCARGASHAEACADVGLVAGGALSVDLRLPPGAVVAGQVFQLDGTPAAGVRLEAVDEMSPGRMPTEAWTDAEGRYRLDGVSPGSVTLFPFSPEGHGASRFIEHVEAGEAPWLEVWLAGFTPVTVQLVREREGKDDVVESVWVAAHLRPQADGSWSGSVESGARTVHVVGQRGDFPLQGWTEVTLSPGVPKTLRVPFGIKGSPKVIPIIRGMERKPRFFELAGHVLLPDGSPAPGAHVSLEVPRNIGPCGNVPRAFSHIRFEGAGFVVRPMTGADKVYAWLDDGRAGSVTLRGQEGEHVVADIRLEETGAVAGVLDFPPEHVPEGAETISIDDQWFGAWQFAQKDGSFFVAGLAPGEHVLDTSHGPVPFTVRARERTELGRVKP